MNERLPFANGLWIWPSDNFDKDEYAEFFDTFEYDGGKAECFISCHDDYALFINGVFVASNQYSDFDRYKIYDRINLTPHLAKGKNLFALTVWYCGGHTMRFSHSVPGTVFEIVGEGNEVILYSSGSTPSRKSHAYMSGRAKPLTSQLGYTFFYDSTKEDGWLMGNGEGFTASAEYSLDRFTFFERPIKKALHLPPVDARIIERSEDGCHYTVDLGAETVGLFTVKLFSEFSQTITVAYGEDLQDGHVRRIIGKRDFSFEYVAKHGENEYTNYFLRLGCRYIEVYSERPIKLNYATVIPQVYPTKAREYQIDGEDEKRIYNICLSTLNLCMMEHYVDCPWREQGLYAFDSRNQMLFGYSAFENGNFEYARANLLLMAKDERADGLLSICFPCTSALAIPSFSLHYFSAVEEYTRHSGDISLAKEVYGKLISVMEVFLRNTKNGLVYTFESDQHWNFYDWVKTLDGHPMCKETVAIPDCIINCLTVRALDAFESICAMAQLTFPYPKKSDALRRRIKEVFYRPEAGLFSMHTDCDTFNVHSSILAILSDVVTGNEAEELCDKLLASDIPDCTLSLKTFKYDALLKTNTQKYRDIVLREIKKDYMPMLAAGATSAWETADGAIAFGNAGSLCHGWSAAPIYYYHRLGIVRQ